MGYIFDTEAATISTRVQRELLKLDIGWRWGDHVLTLRELIKREFARQTEDKPNAWVRPSYRAWIPPVSVIEGGKLTKDML